MQTFLSLGIPCLWTLVMILAYILVKTNKKFPVTYFSNVGYRVDCSPSLAWSKNKNTSIIIGFVFFILMWVAFILAANDLITFGEHTSGANFLVLILELLSIIFFLSGYSSRLVNNYVQVNKTIFDAWVNSGAIEKRGDGYVDIEGDVLLHSFDGKNWIK